MACRADSSRRSPGNLPTGEEPSTTSSHFGFFIGAIPQYSLVVGLFTRSQDGNSPESLVPLTGGGFGGYWPAKIWNTFAQAEFANLPKETFQSPVFTLDRGHGQHAAVDLGIPTTRGDR